MPADRKSNFHEMFEMGVVWEPIAPQARLVWTLAAVAVAAPVLIVLTVLLGVAGGVVGAVAGVTISFGVLAILRWLVVRRHRSWGYSVREEELVLRRGLVVRKLTIVPIGRMQFIDIQQGPLDRWLGVANVQLHTAAAASDAKVPMLTLDDAGRLRDELTTRGAGRSGGT
jgi:membrane protein YdbS with pleckstrin-like domain